MAIAHTTFWRCLQSESIEWLIEDQDFSPSWFGSLPPPSPSSKLSLFLSLPLFRRSSILTGEGGGGGWGAKLYDCENAWSSLNHSILSTYSYMPKTNLSTDILIWNELIIDILVAQRYSGDMILQFRPQDYVNILAYHLLIHGPLIF